MSQITYHPDIPGNVHYPGLGKQCEFCNCYFSCSSDMKAHRTVCPPPVPWNRNDDGSFWVDANKDKAHTNVVLQNGGKLEIGDFEYSLSQNKRWLYKRPI